MDDVPEQVTAQHRFSVPGNLDHVPPFIGEHLWTWTVLFRAFPGVKDPTLDRENLLSVAGIACHYCHTEHTRQVAGRLCVGSTHRL